MSTSDVLTELFGLEGKVAVVTGGTRGIGRMITEGYLRAGVKVHIAARKADELAAAVEELSALGEVVGHRADLSSGEGATGLAEAVAAQEDRLHVLVNNAGATWGAPFAEYPESAFDKLMDINLKGVFLLTQALAPLLEAAGTQDDPARVINVGSINGLTIPSMETYAYSATKAAVHHLTRHLGARLAPLVTVNAIAPGPFPSKMMAASLDAFGDHIADAAPRRRIGEPGDMAGVAIYLASRAGAYVTGAVIPVDGGISTLASGAV